MSHRDIVARIIREDGAPEEVYGQIADLLPEQFNDVKGVLG